MNAFEILDPCSGKAGVGDLVTYEDVANPRRFYRVEQLPGSAASPFEYVLRDVADGSMEWSDLRQAGWRAAALKASSTSIIRAILAAADPDPEVQAWFAARLVDLEAAIRREAGARA